MTKKKPRQFARIPENPQIPNPRFQGKPLVFTEEGTIELTNKTEESAGKENVETRIPDRNINDCKNSLLRLNSSSMSLLKLAEKPPEMFLQALELAKTDGQREKVLSLLESFARAVCGEEDEARRSRITGSMEGCPPDVYFSFCRKPLVAPEKTGEFVETLRRALAQRVRHREILVQELAIFVGRRLSGDNSAMAPLLTGPPGTGKSYITSQLAEAISEAGIKAGIVIQQMTQSAGNVHNEEAPMRLLGTSKKWGNGDCGAIFASLVREKNEITVVFLDEAEKCELRNFLISLLDPKMPLEDSYVKEISGCMDMRPRTLFVLAVNDDRLFCQGDDDPLASRVQKVQVAPYSPLEIREVLMELALRDLGMYGVENKAEVAAIVERTMATYGIRTSLRQLENYVKRDLFIMSLGISVNNSFEGRKNMHDIQTRAIPIGFRPGN